MHPWTARASAGRVGWSGRKAAAPSSNSRSFFPRGMPESSPPSTSLQETCHEERETWRRRLEVTRRRHGTVTVRKRWYTLATSIVSHFFEVLDPRVCRRGAVEARTIRGRVCHEPYLFPLRFRRRHVARHHLRDAADRRSPGSLRLAKGRHPHQ